MLTSIPSNVSKAFQANILEPVSIYPAGFFYLVDFEEDIVPRYHHVLLAGPNGASCSCASGAECPAVQYVQEYLTEVQEQQSADREGVNRQAIPLPHPTFEAIRPARCPICQAATRYAARLSSPYRGEGWRCARGGAGHYWLNRVYLTQRLSCSNNRGRHVAASR